MSLPDLHTAALNCEMETLLNLIAEGADVDARDDSGETALFCAVAGDMFIWHHQFGSKSQKKKYNKFHRQYMEIAEHLIANGADVNAVTNLGMKLIDNAALLGNAAFIQLLERHGASRSAPKRRSLWDKLLRR